MIMISKYWKKVWFFSFFVSIIFWNLAFANEFDVTSYEVDANIRIDGTIDVNEKIDVNFHQYMHGIERFLEKFYDVGDLEFKTIYENIEVIGDKYQNFYEYGDIYTRIGDANETIIWEHQYNIDYTTYGLIRNFSWMWYSELYWDMIGYEWWVNINKVKIQISLPKSYTWFTVDDFIISAGYSYEENKEFEWEITWDENNIYITYDKNLNPYEGITLAVKFPNNYFEYDHERQASLFVGYNRDYRITNYKLSGIVSKTWNIAFESNVDLEILNNISYMRWSLPFNYSYNGKKYLIKRGWLNVNWNDYKTKEYDTTEYNQTFDLLNLSGTSNIKASYWIYGLIRPFTGEDEERAYRMFLPLPIFNTYEDIDNFELELEFPQSDFPNFCSWIYREDISFIIDGQNINLDEFYDKWWSLWCEDNKLSMIYNDTVKKTTNLILMINLTEGLFDLDDDLLEALAVIGDWQFYYGNKMNTPSRIFLVCMLIFWWGFTNLISKRYKKNTKNNKYIVQYDTPKWIEPPEAGILIDDKLDPKDITSLIYRWASNKYIKICAENDKNKKFYIKKLKNLPESAKEYQKKLFKKLFSDGSDFYFSANKSKFETYLTQTEKDLQTYIDRQNRYKYDFSKIPLNAYSFKSDTKTIIFWIAVLWWLVYCFTVTWINSTLNSVWSWMIWVFWIWLIWIICSYRWKEKEQWTTEWIQLRQHCLWFKEFLEKVDKKKIEELTKEDPLFVEKSLPYAVVFWIETEFIKKITPEMLSWYNGDFDDLLSSVKYIRSFVPVHKYSSYSGRSSSSYSYSSSFGHSSGSSFGGWWFSSGWWGGWGWWRGR